MSEEFTIAAGPLTPREHRWLMALLVLATLAAGFLVIDYVGKWFYYFWDVIMIFFLAWLLAFILSPLSNFLVRVFPGMARGIAVIIVYTILVVVVFGLILLLAQQLYANISALVDQWKNITPDQLRERVKPLQDWLDSIGLGQVNVANQVRDALDSLQRGADQLVGPLSNIAVASLGIMGNLLFVFFLSLYMALDKDRIVRFLFRVVPPAYTEEARLLELSVAKSFGGFLRGQALMGLIYGLISMVTSTILGIPYMPVTAVSSGVLQAIPFFGPFVSWAPPVLAALFFKPEVAIIALALMVAGWFVLMNIVQPRLMSEAVGLHPVAVLGSVMIGSKLAGIPGAIFGIPVAAVVASFFFYYLGRSRPDTASVTSRAAARVEQREGRAVRVPRLPMAGEDQEVDTVVTARARVRQPMARAKSDRTSDGPSEPQPAVDQASTSTSTEGGSIGAASEPTAADPVEGDTGSPARQPRKRSRGGPESANERP